MADGGGWIGKYGVPSLILSAAVFAFQQQQQIFDRRQNNVESGYQFYSEQRTSLHYAGDVESELSLLRIVGRAFPSIYCDVRQDLYNRAYEAEDRTGLADTTGRTPIDAADIEILQNALNEPQYDRPAEAQYPRNVIENFTLTRARACDPLGEQEQQVAENGAAQQSPAATTEAAPAPSASEAAETAPGGQARPRIAVRSSAPTTTPATAPTLAAAPTLMRVFMHVPLGGVREAGIQDMTDTARSELASSNFRVMRGVERIAPRNFPREPTIRYFGPEQEDEARALAEYLNYQYRNEDLHFSLVAIGDRYPNMPPNNIEVWIPNPRGGAPAQ
ncbi:MAG TPA: hypothetical protein VEA80_02375 [Vitreimonas sp.]|uniref:hypothetical protein n=1 Tax=Vitreimonas sp. TaxID=3069702 RepID=UPI002D316845|nr:hypothetical protein [Vitreimonas sp.]HYD86296.1 hypothetical protein [Vitreimonas sp.]